MLLQGLFVPLTCPFTRDGVSYLRKLEGNVGRYSKGPAAGMIALVPGTEAAALTDAEAHATLQTIGSSASKEKVLLAGVERASVRAALALAEHAAVAGFDAILLAPPTDWARLVHQNDARELLLFYLAVADASPLHVVLWSDASPPSLQLPVTVVAQLARHQRVIGVMDADLTLERAQALRAATASVQREVTVTTIFEAATRRMVHTQSEALVMPQPFVTVQSLSGGTAVAAPAPAPPVAALKTRLKTVGFQILSAGPAHAVVPLLGAGVSGFAPTLAACAPQACFEAYAAWKDGDHALAAERSERLDAAEQFCRDFGPAAVKFGCDWNGYFGGLPRVPRLPILAAQGEQFSKLLESVRN